MKKIIKTTLTVTTSLYLCACSALTPARQTVTITSNVEDAKIIVNGEIVGKGSTTTQVIRNKNVNIMTIKEGYTPAVHTINKHNNIQGVLDAFTCGFGLIIFAIPWCVSAFAAPGAWSLDETDVKMLMFPDSSNKKQ